MGMVLPEAVSLLRRTASEKEMRRAAVESP